MPFLNHHAPDIATSDLSPADTPAPADAHVTEIRAARVVAHAAKDSDDERMLLETLGLTEFGTSEALAG